MAAEEPMIDNDEPMVSRLTAGDLEHLCSRMRDIEQFADEVWRSRSDNPVVIIGVVVQWRGELKDPITQPISVEVNNEDELVTVEVK